MKLITVLAKKTIIINYTEKANQNSYNTEAQYY